MHINWFDLTPLPLLVFPMTLLSTFLYKIQAHYLLHRQPPLQSQRCDRFRLLPKRLKTIDVPVRLSCHFPVWTKHKGTLEPKLDILIPYSLASPEECKLMRVFVQINLSQSVVRSRGERSHLQQGNDSQISYLFFFLILISLANSFCIFDDGI